MSAIRVNSAVMAAFLNDMGICLPVEVEISSALPEMVACDLPPQTKKLFEQYPDSINGMYSPMCKNVHGVWRLIRHSIWVRDSTDLYGWNSTTHRLMATALMHEIVHATQAEARGAEGFQSYNDQMERKWGYQDNPLEVEAYGFSEFLYKSHTYNNLLEEVF